MRVPTLALVALTGLSLLMLRVEAVSAGFSDEAVQTSHTFQTPSITSQLPTTQPNIESSSAFTAFNPTASLTNGNGNIEFSSSTVDVTSPGGYGTLTSTTSTLTSTTSTLTSTTNTPIPNPGDSSGLSTGAKVGIAVGATGAALLILIVILLLWRRGRQRKSNGLPGGTMAYTDDRGSSMNRDLNAEKDMKILSSPVGAYTSQETGHGPPYVSPHSPESQQPPRAETHSTSASWPHDNQRDSYDAVGGESYVPPQAPTPPPGAATTAASGAGSGFSRKPVGGTANLIQEPGMSDDEVARLEEEERRIDEAIAEAERRRNGPVP